MPDHPYLHRSARLRGYTLIELLIVIGILGLAAAMLIPHLVGQDNMKAQAAVRRIISDLSFAQSDALAYQEYRRVHFYSDGRGFCLERVDDSDYDLPFDEATADLIVDPLSGGGDYIVDFTADNRFEGVAITSVNIDGGGEGIGDAGADLVFDILGGTLHAGGPGTGGTIVIGVGEDSYQISIAPFTGKLTVQRLGG